MLLSGDIHASVSNKKRSFPRSYKCYTEDYTDISNLVDQIGIFETLVVGTTSYSNCRISNLNSIYEIVRGSGKWTYNIEFSQADTGHSASIHTCYSDESLVTVYVYIDEPLAAGASLDSLPVDLTNCYDVNIYVSNTGDSDSLTVEIEGSYSSAGDIKTSVFVCNLDTEDTDSGAPFAAPPNFIFIHASNNDLVNDTTFSIVITKHINL